MGLAGTPPPTRTELARVGDRLSFVYLERCVVNRDANAVTAATDRGTVHIPSVTLGCLLLGPGTRITNAAMALLGDCGASVVWCGENWGAILRPRQFSCPQFAASSSAGNPGVQQQVTARDCSKYVRLPLPR